MERPSIKRSSEGSVVDGDVEKPPPFALHLPHSCTPVSSYKTLERFSFSLSLLEIFRVKNKKEVRNGWVRVGLSSTSWPDLTKGGDDVQR